MEASIILGAFVLLLVIAVICLGNKYNKCKETLKETELDLQEYVRQAHNDAKTINELKMYIKTSEMCQAKIINELKTYIKDSSKRPD